MNFTLAKLYLGSGSFEKVEWNRITDRGARILSDSIKNNNTVQTLNLSTPHTKY